MKGDEKQPQRRCDWKSFVLLLCVFISCFCIMSTHFDRIASSFSSGLAVNTRLVYYAASDESTATNYRSDLLYHIDVGSRHVTGHERFNVSRTTLVAARFPLTRFSAVNDDDKSLVFVTAADDGHFHEAMDGIARVQMYFPAHVIYFYDLNKTPNRTVGSKLSQLCSVVYRRFNFSRYPSHVADLHTYAFKPLIVHEVLREHSHAFWMDASIRFKHSNLSRIVHQATNESIGLLLFEWTITSIYAVTNPGMYRYLPIDEKVAKKVMMRGACAIYIRSTQKLYDAVIRWWVLCALDPDCIAPPAHRLGCDFRNGTYAVFAQCHRYDQSAIDILLTNRFNGSVEEYFSRDETLLSDDRDSQHRERFLVCAADGNIYQAASKEFYYNVVTV